MQLDMDNPADWITLSLGATTLRLLATVSTGTVYIWYPAAPIQTDLIYFAFYLFLEHTTNITGTSRHKIWQPDTDLQWETAAKKYEWKGYWEAARFHLWSNEGIEETVLSLCNMAMSLIDFMH